jgi:hypothetical protein
MTSYRSRLLGFDIRLSPDDYLESAWDKERRLSYLLRPKTEWPLSVDTLVWPSVFFPKIYGTQPLIAVDPETAISGFWLNLQLMGAAFASAWKRQTLGIPIGIHLFAEEGLSADQFGSLVLETHPIPEECPEGSGFLGYDVADSGLISGLCNCGFLPGPEKNRWQAEWEDHLNEFGLLRTLDAALGFRDATDQRVPEHAPFYVFGISRLPA